MSQLSLASKSYGHECGMRHWINSASQKSLAATTALQQLYLKEQQELTNSESTQ